MQQKNYFWVLFEEYDNLFISIVSLLHFYYQLSPNQTTYMNTYISTNISTSKNYSKPPVLPWLSSQYSTFSLTGCELWMKTTWNRQVFHTFKFCTSALLGMSEVITLFSRTFIFSTHIIGTYLKYAPVQISWCQQCHQSVNYSISSCHQHMALPWLKN